MKKIVILYSKTGGGHLSDAKALSESIKKFCPGCQVELVDPLPEIFSILYAKLNSDYQKLWGWSWHFTNHRSLKRIFGLLNKYQVKRIIKSVVEAHNPDLLISNHPLLVAALDEINNIPTIVHVIDPFTPHSLWFSSKKSFYLCTTPECKNIALKHKINKDKIYNTGWLIKKSEPVDKRGLIKALGLEKNKFTIFIGGAGQGGGKIYQLLKALTYEKQILDKGQIILNVGLNPNLIAKVTPLVSRFQRNILFLPYVRNIENFIQISDLVIGKAGPNFMFENLKNKSLFMAIGCLPGQEEGNIDFLKKYKVGIVETSISKAVNITRKIIDGKINGKKIINNIKRVEMYYKDADQKTGVIISQLLNQPVFQKRDIQALPRRRH